MRSIFLTIILGFVSLLVHSQNIQIKGNVVDASGAPLPGVNILVKNTNLGGTTDFDGNFAIANIPVGAVLQISYVGYTTKVVKLTNSNFLKIQLQEDSQALEEVVIIGYGTQKVSKVSGAVSSVGKAQIENLKPVRAEEALQGQASGVNVISSGSPGATPTVLIRGIPSYTGTNPLVVIDGVTQTLEDLNSLNPSDIESMNVLKDAALTAIYGVSGGNGVIVVKTKSGKKNTKTTFGYDSSYGIQEVFKTINVLNASEYAAILNEASVASGGNLIYNNLNGLGLGTNWQKEVLKEAPISINNFTATGGSENSSFFLSAGYLAQDGVVGGGDKSYFNRANLTANYTTDINKKLTAIINTSYANIKGKGLSENNIGSVLSNALNFDPTVAPYDATGNFGISNTITQEIKNPLAQINDTYNKGNTNKLFGKLELQYDILENFKVTSRFGYTYVDVVSKNFTPLVYYGVGHNQTTAHPDLSPIVTVDSVTGDVTSTHSRVSEAATNYFSYTYEIYGNYNFKIAKDHTFETVLGYSIGKNSGSNITANAEDIPFNSWEYADVSSATGDAKSQTSGSWQYENRNLSYFSRINYDYKEKYLLSFTSRFDGSTSFGKNNKFAFFPSASLGWVVSNEDFWKSGIVDYLKVRGSYGSVGNDNISPQFARISTFPKYTFDGNIVSGSTLLSIPNDDVTWENQIQYNAGLDLKMFSNRISLNADYFVKTVDDLLFSPTLSLYLGTPAYPAANIGKTKSSGIDLSLGYNDTYFEKFSINTNLSFTTSKNEVVEINNGDKFIWGAGYGIPYTTLTRFEEGFSPGYFFGYKTDGIFQNQAEVLAHATQTGAQPGDIRYADVNQDGIINDLDRTKIGDPFPDFTLGWNLSFDFMNFDFNVFTYASVGGDIYRAYDRNLNFTNKYAGVLDRWKGEGTSNTEPRVAFIDTNNNRRASDRYVEDGSFVKIKNIQLGYTLPESAFKSAKFTKVRLYAQVKNAYTFTDYSGFDPEISSGVLDTGIDRGSYPQPRTWSVGVNVKF
ncbi:MAG TPA: TonB-dependent receptor [Flavobacteriaceae bacterium]|nr:TonB-dependent receptor [Flavobacteriaceae bacterium]